MTRLVFHIVLDLPSNSLDAVAIKVRNRSNSRMRDFTMITLISGVRCIEKEESTKEVLLHYNCPPTSSSYSLQACSRHDRRCTPPY